MGGVTPHGIRYPDGASKAKNLGPELKTMAEDIDTFLDELIDAANPIFNQIVQRIAEQIVPPMVPPLVEAYLDENARIPEAGDERTFEVVDRTNAVAFSIDKDGRSFLADGVDSGRDALQIIDKDGALAFEVSADGVPYMPGATGSDGAGVSVTRARVVLGFGQSLGSGRAVPFLPSFDVTHSQLWQVGHKSRTLRLATSPLDMQDDPTGISPAWVYGIDTAREAAPNEVVVIIPAAMGGTGLVWQGSNRGCWNPDYTGPNRALFAETLTHITDALALIRAQWPGVEIIWEAALWNQGESDAVNGVSQSAYATALDELIRRLRTHVGTQIPFVIGQSVREWIASEPGAASIQRAQIDTLSRQQCTAFAYMPPNGANSPTDLLHANRGAIETLGRRMRAAREEALANADGVPPVAPPNVAAYVAGGTLHVTWERPLCRVTDYRVEYRTGAGTWTSITRSSPLGREASAPVSGNPVEVRITTIDGASESYTTTPIHALGA